MNKLLSNKSSIGQIICGNELGTAFYVGNGVLLTCRHCIIDHILDPNVPISIAFGNIVIEATMPESNFSKDFDIALLVLPNANHDLSGHIPLVISHLPRGLEWTTFGFPRIRRNNGMQLEGIVSQWVASPAGPPDTILICDNFSTLDDYGGFSGAPIIVDGTVRGILQQQGDGCLHAISLARLRHELSNAGVAFTDKENHKKVPKQLAGGLKVAVPNIETYSLLENALMDKGGYVLLTGTPGSGKSLIAAGYAPAQKDIVVVSRYFIKDPEQGAPTPSYYGRVDVFSYWLSQQTMLFSADAAVVSRSTHIEEAISAVVTNLGVLGEWAKQSSQLAVIIIDDAESILDRNNESFFNYLPTNLPENVAIVITTINSEVLTVKLQHLNISTVVEVARLSRYDRELLISQSMPNADVETILTLSQESQGHPLLLTYLIAAAQESGAKSVSDVKQFQDVAAYYDNLWKKFAEDAHTHWLLATLARVRGMVSGQELLWMMPTDLQMSFQKTLRSIQHLLATHDGRFTFYHSSFADFVISKTIDLDSTIHERLANYCHDQNTNYALANRLFHNLLAGEKFLHRAIVTCDQKWADEVAIRCVAPTWIMADIDNVLRECANNGNLIDLLKVLLLRSRIRFRYNEVFAEFAHELAEVVLILRGPSEALGYLERDGAYLCSVSNVSSILTSLQMRGYKEYGYRFFEGFRRVFWRELKTHAVSPTDLQHFMLATCLGTNDFRTLQADIRRIKNLFENDDNLTVLIWGYLFGDTLWRTRHIFVPKEELENAPRRLVSTLAVALNQANKKRFYYARPKNNEQNIQKHPDLVSEKDIAAICENLVKEYGVLPGLELEVASAMIWQQCEPSLVKMLSRLIQQKRPSLRAENNVDASLENLEQIYQLAQVQAYIYEDTTFLTSNWEDRLACTAHELGKASGRSHRRRREGENIQDINHIMGLFSEIIISLEERSLWERSYHIPETVIPQLIAWGTIWMVEFRPDSANEWVDFVLGMPSQLGIYTEGYRAALRHIIDILGANPMMWESARRIETLFLQYVTKGVFTRRERISELLNSARAAAEFNACEMAEEAFRTAVTSSTGPSWYKENQFSLIQTALEISTTDSEIQRAVGLLELASNELTFQRFVRHHKQWMIGHLAKKGSEQSALNLFLHYILPSPQIQLNRLMSLSVDKLDELRGGRFGVFEVEQQGGAAELLSRLVDASPFKLWAFIELFWPMDKRYEDDFVTEAQKLLATGDEKLRARFLRMLRVDIQPDRRESFVSAISQNPENSVWFSKTAFAVPTSKTVSVSKPTVESATKEPQDDASELVLPGIFGDPKALEELRNKIKTSNRLVSSGDRGGAITLLLDGLVCARNSGWQIWRDSGEAKNALETLLAIEENRAKGVSRLANLIISDQWTQDWVIAQRLVDLLQPQLSNAEATCISELLFEHVEILLGPELAQIDTMMEQEDLKHLAPCSPDNCIVQLFVAFLDHPDWHTRARVADIIFWLLENGEMAIDVLIDVIKTRDIGYGKELSIGLLDAFIHRHNLKTDLSAFELDPSVVVRLLANSNVNMPQMIETYDDLKYKWPTHLETILLTQEQHVRQKAEAELNELTKPISTLNMSSLWKIRELGGASATRDIGNPFEREAVFRALPKIPTEHETTSTLLPYNRLWPDADLENEWRPLNTEICKMIANGSRDPLNIDGETLLHSLELTVDKKGRITTIEIMAVFVASDFFNGVVDIDRAFRRESVHVRQTENFCSSVLIAPTEPAACTYQYSCMVGGHLTPATPSAFTTNILGQHGFSSHIWRNGREWRPVGPGKPLSQCVALTVSEQKIKHLLQWRLIWVVRTADGHRLFDPASQANLK